MSNWHETFSRWSKPPSDTEEDQGKRAARMVRQALREHPALTNREFEVVAVGSYRNNTNVKRASDIDLAAVFRSAWWSELPQGGAPTREMLGLVDSKYGIADFRRDVEQALRDKFGATDVAPGKITVTVDDSSARLGADLTPHFAHRRYTGGRQQNGDWAYDEGIETRPKDAPQQRIVHWPEQHYAAGVVKNEATNHRYKRIVRILKCLRNEMSESGSSAARPIAGLVKSCFIEHAVYNVPNSSFNLAEGSYVQDVRAVLTALWNAARDRNRASAFVEVNGMQGLFRPNEPWSPDLLERFTAAAWQHLGFSS